MYLFLFFKPTYRMGIGIDACLVPSRRQGNKQPSLRVSSSV